MYKYLFVFVACCAVSSARPSSWQLLPPKPGYIPVYIQHGDTPLEEINLELAEAFHALPSGRSAGKDILAEGKDQENNVAVETLGAPHPPDVESPAASDDTYAAPQPPSDSSNALLQLPAVNSGSYEREASLFPPEPKDSKRAHEKKYKKAGSGNIQKIPVN